MPQWKYQITPKMKVPTRFSWMETFGLFPLALLRSFLSFKSYQHFFPDSILNKGIATLPKNSDLQKKKSLLVEIMRSSITNHIKLLVISVLIINCYVQNWMNVSDRHVEHFFPWWIDSFVFSVCPPHAVVQFKHNKRITFATQVSSIQPLGTKDIYFKETNILEVARKESRLPRGKV